MVTANVQIGVLPLMMDHISEKAPLSLGASISIVRVMVSPLATEEGMSNRSANLCMSAPPWYLISSEVDHVLPEMFLILKTASKSAPAAMVLLFAGVCETSWQALVAEMGTFRTMRAAYHRPSSWVGSPRDWTFR